MSIEILATWTIFSISMSKILQTRMIGAKNELMRLKHEAIEYEERNLNKGNHAPIAIFHGTQNETAETHPA